MLLFFIIFRLGPKEQLNQNKAKSLTIDVSALYSNIQREDWVDIDGTGLDSRLDKKMFLEKNEAASMIPKKFEYILRVHP